MKEVYSPAEVARICHVTKPTVHKWISLGKLKCITLPHGFRKVPAEELKRFLGQAGILFPGVDVQGGKTKILLVDDEQPVLRLLKDLITTYAPDGAVEVATCPDGVQACIKIGLWVPDLAILDIRMPGMNGFEVIQKIREHPELSRVKILILTGHFEESMLPFIDKYGLEGILTKPLTIEMFKQKIVPLLKDKWMAWFSASAGR